MNVFADRRNKAQLESARAIEQERADKRIEDIWRQKVRRNPKEMARLRKGQYVNA